MKHNFGCLIYMGCNCFNYGEGAAMSDFTEYSEFYKRAWERSLSERTSDMQKEIETLRAENARYREALEFYADRGVWGNGCAAIDPCDTYTDELNILRGGSRAREALKGGE